MKPKSELAEKLKALLDNMTQEEFDKDWTAITALNLGGPTFKEALQYFAVVQNQLGRFELNNAPSTNFSLDDNFSLAA